MYDARIHDSYICDPNSLTLIHVSMMHISVMRLKFCDGPTNGRTRQFLELDGIVHRYYVVLKSISRMVVPMLFSVEKQREAPNTVA